MQDKIKIYTLFDITATGILHPGSYHISTFIDKAGQTINDINSWEKSRNQHRNWQTIIQLIGLREQPEFLSTPRKISANLSQFEFGNIYDGTQSIWTAEFVIGHIESYTKDNELDLLKLDFNLIPLIINLNETVNINPHCLITNGNYCNTYFQKVSSN